MIGAIPRCISFQKNNLAKKYPKPIKKEKNDDKAPIKTAILSGILEFDRMPKTAISYK